MKALTENDREELDDFAAYLADAKTMSREELFFKWQHFLCLSDEEIKTMWKKAAQKK